VRLYARRFQCEEAFRDLKDRRYGYGLRSACLHDCQRRDRLLLLYSLANLVQLLVGMGSEMLGLDKGLRANTSRERTHSLVRQGRDLLGNLAHATYDSLRTVIADLIEALVISGLNELGA
jgi:hypothetical protein